MPKDMMGVTLSISSSSPDVADIMLEEVTATVRISATGGFNRGDIHIGKHSRKKVIHQWGVWQYSTRHLIHSDDICDHIEWILQTFESRTDALKRYVDDDRYSVILYIWFEGPYGLSGFGLSKEMVSKMIELCNEISFVIALQNDVDEQIAHIQPLYNDNSPCPEDLSSE
jgi:hypothetical protein